MNISLEIVIVILLIGCNSADTSTPPSENNDSTEKAKVYFPVLDFIKSEIRHVDSLPIGIVKYTTENGVTDSNYIKPEEFHHLAQQFVLPALKKETFEKEFAETSFFDNTTQYASFVYSTHNGDLDVQRVDVLAKPQDVVYNKVQSIYIEKRSGRADSSITQKMYWKAGQNFQITTEVQTKSETISRQIKVVWNAGY
jgi:hypothetical protein